MATPSHDPDKMRAALLLIWRLYNAKNTHLGYERASGVEQGCIGCICAAALDMGMDFVSAAEIQQALAMLESEQQRPAAAEAHP